MRNVKSRRTRSSLLAELAEEGDEIILTNPMAMYEGMGDEDAEGSEEDSGSGETESGEEEDSEDEDEDEYDDEIEGAQKGDLFAEDDDGMDEDGAR